MVEVTDRSMPPVIRTSVCPSDIARSGRRFEKTLARLAAESKARHDRRERRGGSASAQESRRRQSPRKPSALLTRPPAFFPATCAPHMRRRHLGLVALVDDEAGSRITGGTACRPSRRGRAWTAALCLEVDVLHARRVEVALLEHPVGGRVAVEAAQEDVARLRRPSGSGPRRFRAETIEGSRKSDEVKMKSMSGFACSALVTPARAFSWFHSVGMRATTSIASAHAVRGPASKPSRRPIALMSPRSPIRMAAFVLLPRLPGQPAR